MLILFFFIRFQISSISVVTTCTNTETNSQTTGKSRTKSQRSDDISVISEPRRNQDIEDEHSSIVEENSTAV